MSNGSFGRDTLVDAAVNATTLAGTTPSAFALTTLDDATAAAFRATIGAVGNLLRAPQILTGGSGATYTPATGAVSCLVLAIGGGGGGGGAATAAVSAACGSGGGSGAWGWRYYATAGATFTHTEGAGGAGGDSAGNNGAAGSNTTFSDGTTVLTCPGGGSGRGSAADVTDQILRGGVNSSGPTNADVGSAGTAGAPSIRLSGTVAAAGNGGSSPWGAGGMGPTDAGAGTAGQGYGAGGSGGLVENGSAGVAGGAGSNGVVIVWDFG